MIGPFPLSNQSPRSLHLCLAMGLMLYEPKESLWLGGEFINPIFGADLNRSSIAGAPTDLTTLVRAQVRGSNIPMTTRA